MEIIFWKKLSIKNKINSIILLITFFTIAIGSFINTYIEIKQFKTNLIQNSLVIGQLIAENCAPTIDFGYPERALEILNRLDTIPNIKLCKVYTIKKNLFAGFTRHGEENDSLKELPPEHYRFKGDDLEITMPLIYKGDNYGNLYLKLETKISQTIRRRVLTVILIIFVLFVFAYFIANKLQKIISDPIVQLAKISNEVSLKNDYNVRLTKTTHDEIGKLYDQFNDMLTVIQKRKNERDNAIIEISQMNLDLENRVNERTKKLAAANRELNDLAYISAHDLKTPLRGIAQLASWLSTDYKDLFDENGKQQIELLISRVKRMNNLVNALLKYTVIGSFETQKTEINVNEIINESISTLNPPANIKFEINENFPTIIGDKNHFKAIFTNLIENAIKFNDKTDGKVEIGFTDEKTNWQFYVTDNGCGIDEKYHDKIFKIFQTLTSSYDSETTGIGLPIARKIVEFYDGNIWLKSVVGQGSTFYFTINKQPT